MRIQQERDRNQNSGHPPSHPLTPPTPVLVRIWRKNKLEAPAALEGEFTSKVLFLRKPTLSTGFVLLRGPHASVY